MAQLTGSCNHCGKCCLRSGGFMVNNCMIEDEDECKFYVEELVGGHCLVYIALDKGIIEEARDKYDNKITPHQLLWFKQNCPPWPKDDMVNKLLPTCGFGFTDV